MAADSGTISMRAFSPHACSPHACNREYSAAHTDAMLPLDPPLLPGLLARAEALDARERAAFEDRLAEHERRHRLGPEATATADLDLAQVLREAVVALAQEPAAVLCLRFGLAGDRPRRHDEVARLLGMDAATVRRLEADGLAALREPDRSPRSAGRTGRNGSGTCWTRLWRLPRGPILDTDTVNRHRWEDRE